MHGKLGEARKKPGKGLWCDGTDPILLTSFEEGDEVYKAVPFNLPKDSMKRQTRCYSKQALHSEGPGMRRRDNGPFGEPLTQEDRNRFFPIDDEDDDESFVDFDFGDGDEYDFESDSDNSVFDPHDPIVPSTLRGCINRVLAQQNNFNGVTNLELVHNDISLPIYRTELDSPWRYRQVPLADQFVQMLEAACQSFEGILQIGGIPVDLQHIAEPVFRLRFP